jgi:predicted MFS family arabinose efflux permease
MINLKREHSGEPISGWRSWYSLLLLCGLYTLNSIDRNVASITAKALKREFRLSDTELGAMVGLAYALPFALGGVAVGAVVERTHRGRLIAGLLAIWSALTFVSGLTSSFAQLVCARVGVAASEAGASPTAMSLIMDLFPKNRRSRALSVYYFSTPVGLFVGFALGGLVLAQFGWRAAFFVAGAPGLLLALVILATFKEPPLGAYAEAADLEAVAQRSRLSEALQALWTRKTLLYLLLAAMIQTTAQSAVGAFLAPFFIRIAHVPVREAGLWVSVALGIGAAVGMLIGGVMGDVLAKRSPGLSIGVVGFAMIGAGGCALMAFASAEALSIVAWAGVFSVLLALYYGPTYATYMSLAPLAHRGALGALIVVLNSLVGYGLGPPLVGALSDLIARQGIAESLRWALSAVVCLYFVAALFFLAASRTAGRDAKAAAAG